jgi:hypothetical protein
MLAGASLVAATGFLSPPAFPRVALFPPAPTVGIDRTTRRY